MEFSAANDCLKAIRHIDHVTYVSAFESEQRFLQQWRIFGFDELESRGHCGEKTVWRKPPREIPPPSFSYKGN